MKRSVFFLLLIVIGVYGYYLYQTTPHPMIAQEAGRSPVLSSQFPLSIKGTDATDTLVGAPSVSAAFMNQVLQQAGSPARGLGQTLYELGMQYHIDSVYALAFFHHESEYGRVGMATVTHSLGNIVCTQGWTCIQGFRSYPSWQAGARDWFVLIASYVTSGRTTLTAVLTLYSPSAAGNNTQAYIDAVRHDVRQWRGGQVAA